MLKFIDNKLRASRIVWLFGVALVPAIFAEPGDGLKNTIRIDEFKADELSAKYIASISFQDVLRSEMSSIGKYSVVKRDDLRETIGEIENSQSGLFAEQTQQSLGGFKSAHYALGGSLELIDRQKERGLKKLYTSRASIRITKISDATEASMVVEHSDYVQSPSDLFKPLAYKIAVQATLDKYPIKVAAVHGDTAILNYGSSILEAGDILGVFESREIIDPDTGNVISRKATRQGSLRVISVDQMSAEAQPVDGEVAEGAVCKIEVAEGDEDSDEASSSTENNEINRTGTKPTITIGKFMYSAEFDLSQTAERSGKPITSAGAGQGSGSMLGAIVGGLVKGGKPEDWLAGAAVGALAGGVVDSERRQYEHGEEPKGAEIPSDQAETAITKESQVLKVMVSTKLDKTGKFTLINPDRVGEIKKIMDNEADGDYDESNLVERGKLKSARYSAFGTITRFETNRKQTGFSIAGGSEAVEMKITADLSVVDNETGDTVISETITGSVTSKNSQAGFLGFGSASENQGAIGELMDSLSLSLAAKIATTLVPIKITSVNAKDRVVVLNYGETVVGNGYRLDVFDRGEEIVDEDTGEIIGHSETKVGMIEVVDLQPRFSKGKIIRPASSKGVDVIRKGQICRVVNADVPSDFDNSGF